jgi:hypothetical protein
VIVAGVLAVLSGCGRAAPAVDPFVSRPWGNTHQPIGEEFAWGFMTLTNEHNQAVVLQSITPRVQGFDVLGVKTVGFPRTMGAIDVTAWPADASLFGAEIREVAGTVVPPRAESDDWSILVLIGLRVREPRAEARGIDVVFTVDGRAFRYVEPGNFVNCADAVTYDECPEGESFMG